MHPESREHALWMEGWIDKYKRQTDGQIDKIDGWIGRQAHRPTGREAGRLQNPPEPFTARLLLHKTFLDIFAERMFIQNPTVIMSQKSWATGQEGKYLTLILFSSFQNQAND